MKNSFGVILFFIVQTLVAQDSEFDKYFYYRKRLLEKFVVVGTSENCGNDGGKSLIFSEVNVYNPDNDKYKMRALGLGDGTTRLGWYIGVLATEAKLMENANINNDATLYELYCVLKAFDRLDAKAEKRYYRNLNYECSELNGFFIRDDVSHDFVMEYMKTHQWISKEYYEDAKRLKEYNKSTNSSDYKEYYQTGNLSSLVTLNNPSSTQTVGDFLSTDQITHMMMGLALVKRSFENRDYYFVGNDGKRYTFNFHNDAIEKVRRFASLLKKSDPSCHINQNRYISFGPLTSLINGIINKIADDVILGSFWLDPEGKELNCNNKIDENREGYLIFTGLNYAFGGAFGYFGVSFSDGSEYVWNNVIKQNATSVGTTWGQNIVLIIASISNNWLEKANFSKCELYSAGILSDDCEGFSKCKDSGVLNPSKIKNETYEWLDKFALDENKKLTVYPLLHRYLHYPNYTKTACSDNFSAVTQISREYYWNDLSTAPCYGPKYKYGSDPNVADFEGTPGWRVSNRFEKYLERYSGPSNGQPMGEMDGLDYMLYHNLYRLAFDPQNSNLTTLLNFNDNKRYIDTFSIEVKNEIISSAEVIKGTKTIRVLDESKDNKSNTAPSTSPSNTTSPDKKSEQLRIEPENNFLSTVDPYTKDKQLEEPKYKNATVYSTGKLTYLSSNNIKLTSGFKVKKGAIFIGKSNTGESVNYNCSENNARQDKFFESKKISSSDIQNITIENDISISIHPNPFSYELNIEKNSNDFCKLKVVDLLGNSISEEIEFSSNFLKINTSKFQTGVYFLKFYSPNINKIVKIVKE